MNFTCSSEMGYINACADDSHRSISVDTSSCHTNPFLAGICFFLTLTFHLHSLQWFHFVPYAVSCQTCSKHYGWMYEERSHAFCEQYVCTLSAFRCILICWHQTASQQNTLSFDLIKRVRTFVPRRHTLMALLLVVVYTYVSVVWFFWTVTCASNY